MKEIKTNYSENFIVYLAYNKELSEQEKKIDIPEF